MQDDASMRKKAALQELDAPRGEVGKTTASQETQKELMHMHRPGQVPATQRGRKKRCPRGAQQVRSDKTCGRGDPSSKTSHAWSSGG